MGESRQGQRMMCSRWSSLSVSLLRAWRAFCQLSADAGPHIADRRGGAQTFSGWSKAFVAVKMRLPQTSGDATIMKPEVILVKPEEAARGAPATGEAGGSL